MWSSSFKDSSSIKRFHIPKQKHEEHQNRNTQKHEEHSGTQRNNQQIRRNTKGQQIWTTNQKSQIRNNGGSGGEALLCSSSSCSFVLGAMEAAAMKLRYVLLHPLLPWVLVLRRQIATFFRSLHLYSCSVLAAFFRFCVSSSPTKIEFVRLSFGFLELEIYVALQAQSAIHSKCKASF